MRTVCPALLATRILVVAAAGLLLAQPAHAVDDDGAYWSTVSASGRIKPGGEASRWRYNVMGQWRNFDRGPGSDTYLLRSGIGYDLNPRMSLWAGYDFFVNDPDGGPTRKENRYWQQFLWGAARWDWGRLTLRTRLEERDLENSSDVGLRLRQLVELAVPVPSQDVTLLVSTEHFTNLDDTDYGALSGFDQLRSYLGVRMPMTERASLEAGYMNQLINRSGRADAVNHTATLHLRLSF